MKKLDIPVEQAIALYRRGSTTYEIAAHFGCSRDVIQRRLKTAGVILRAQNPEERMQLFWTRVDKNGPTPAPRFWNEIPPHGWEWNEETNLFEWTEGPCWLWTGTKDANGYGKFQVGGKFLAHRIAFADFYHVELNAFGPLIHGCDTPACVNPRHTLPLGQAANMDDLAIKGKSGQIKFPGEVVVQIRERFVSGETANNLAKEFKVSRITIHRIVTGRSRRTAGGPITTNLAHGPKPRKSFSVSEH